jgi:hypothetical protein
MQTNQQHPGHLHVVETVKTKRRRQIAEIRVGSWRRVDISLTALERGAEKLEAALARLSRSPARLGRLP